MELMLEPVIEGHPYPKLYGGYRCCIKGEWYDCDKYGNITTGVTKGGEVGIRKRYPGFMFKWRLDAQKRDLQPL